MSVLVRAIIAILLGMLVTGILEYFNLLNRSLDVLLGVVVALVFFFGYGDINPRLRQ